MNSRVPANQKFFRRTSKSPWEQARSPIAPDPEALCLQLTNSPISTAIPRVTTDRQKQCSISIANILDENSPNIETLKNIPDASCQKSQGSDKFNRNIGQYRVNGKINDQIKFTYIPIDSMSTLHTLPSTQKKISDFSESIKSYVTMQQYNCLRKQLDKAQNEIKQSNEKQKQTSNQNVKLLKQLETFKRNNHTFEIEIKKIREGFNQAQRNLKLCQITAENYKKNLDVSQFRREKAQQSAKQLSHNFMKMEAELRISREKNLDLNRQLHMKQNQILEISAQLQKQAKKMKSLLQSNQDTDWRGIRQRSTTSYQFNQQQNRNPQHLVVLAPSQKQAKQPIKCNRYIQTESTTFQKSLKQVENLTLNLESKIQNINQLRCEIEDLNYKVKDMDYLTVKVEEFENLVQELNEKVVRGQAEKLANKYRYY